MVIYVVLDFLCLIFFFFLTFFFLPHCQRSLVGCVNNLFHITAMTLCVCRSQRAVGTILAYPPDSLKLFSYHYSSYYCSLYILFILDWNAVGVHFANRNVTAALFVKSIPLINKMSYQLILKAIWDTKSVIVETFKIHSSVMEHFFCTPN